MIKLYKFGAINDVCDPSPFCVKVEAYLRLANSGSAKATMPASSCGFLAAVFLLPRALK